MFGFYVLLEIKGRGFFIKSFNRFLKLNLGFSHSIGFILIDNNKLFLGFERKNNILIYSNDFFLLNNFVFRLKKLKKIDKYKGLGIRFLNENIKLKLGKKAK